MTLHQTEQPTNSLRVYFPEAEVQGFHISVARVYEELASFGEIARLEVPPSPGHCAVVSYYDIRAAANARAAFGDRCSKEPQHGGRTVVLQGDVQVHAWMIPEVAAVRREVANSSYSIDFFDTRAADRAASELVGGQNEDQNHMPARIEVSTGASCLAPRYRNDLRLSEVNWAELASGRDKRTTLRLRMLPSKLCDEAVFQRMLASAGLSQLVDSVCVLPGRGSRPGSALVNAVDSAGVTAVAKYFHGRQWGKSMPVAVSFAAVQGAAEVRRAFPAKTVRTETGVTKSLKDEPWRVETCGSASSVVSEIGVSDVSTETGDDGDLLDASHEVFRPKTILGLASIPYYR